ncbi:MAG TPA: SDR family oxidoreductase [Acidimicrobiales bacterium]|nr:SDR family oxidoreductase [Acidimicrobiales bacterium]
MGDRVAGKVCIVTGAAQGIGAAYARRLASEGADVAIVDLTRVDQAKDVVADIEKMGRRALSIEADVTDPEAMQRMAATVVGELGRVDCLVNNAGLMFDQLTATWEQFLAVNFMGAVNASNAVVPYLWAQRGGSIVNISSTAAFPLPLGNLLAVPDDAPPPSVDPQGYGLTKWMLIFQTRQMARTLGVRNIRVNAVCPGVTMSPATKAVVPPAIVDRLVEAAALHTTLQPEDMTGVVLFLASDDSAKMTGQTIINDAGTWFAG